MREATPEVVEMEEAGKVEAGWEEVRPVGELVGEGPGEGLVVGKEAAEVVVVVTVVAAVMVRAWRAKEVVALDSAAAGWAGLEGRAASWVDPGGLAQTAGCWEEALGVVEIRVADS